VVSASLVGPAWRLPLRAGPARNPYPSTIQTPTPPPATPRCVTLVQSARYLKGIRRYHDRNVKECSFNVGDLVLHRIQNTKGLHKLSSPWEGPFIVAKVTGPCSYRLQTLKGEDLNNSWNIDQLYRFYA
jgi:hypothetical protein